MNNKPDDIQFDQSDRRDMLKSVALIIVCIILLSMMTTLLYLGYQNHQVINGLAKAKQSMQSAASKGSAGLNKMMNRSPLGGDDNSSNQITTPPATGSISTSSGTDNTSKPGGDVVATVVAGLTLLFCVGQWNADMECLLIALALLILAIILYVVGNWLSEQEKKCKSKKKKGFWGFLLKLLCFLITITKWICWIVAAVAAIAAIILFVVCAYNALGVLKCIFGLLPAFGA